jgi:hypothetical protein
MVYPTASLITFDIAARERLEYPERKECPLLIDYSSNPNRHVRHDRNIRAPH